MRRIRPALLCLLAILLLPIWLPAQPAAAGAFDEFPWEDPPGGPFLVWDALAESRATFQPSSPIVIYEGAIDYINNCTRAGSINDGFIRAADVYIVPMGDLSPGMRLFDVANSPNTAVSNLAGGLFDGMLIGQAEPAGPIPIGHYAVVYDECQDGFLDEGVDFLLAPAFSVVPGPVDVPAVPDLTPLKQAALIRAQDMRDRNIAVFVLGNVLKVTGFLTRLGNISILFTAAARELFPDVDGRGGLGIPNAKDAAFTMTFNMFKHYFAIYNDPPDFNYQTVEPLGDRVTPAAESDDPLLLALAAVADASADEQAAALALLRAVERYQGAEIRNDAGAALMQARAVQEYARQLAGLVGETNAALGQLRAALASDPRSLDATLAEMEAIRRQVAANGFSAEARREAAHLGIGEAALDALRDEYAAGSYDFTRAGLIAGIDATRANEPAVVAGLNAYADAIEPVIGELSRFVFDERPAASAGGPYAGQVGQPVSFSALGSTSLRRITSFAWDLDGDGAFDDATGPTPSFTYARPFSGQIGVRAARGGLVDIAYAPIVVSDPNAVPRLTAAAPADLFVQLEVGGSQSFSVSATDPDGDPLQVSWEVGATARGTGASFSYAPTAAEVGIRAVSAVVSDGRTPAGIARYTWQVAVLMPDGDGDGWRSNHDCDDANPNVNPGRGELFGNGIDDDCNPATGDAGAAPVAAFAPQGSGRNVALAEDGAEVVASSNPASPGRMLIDYLSTDGAWRSAPGQVRDQFVTVRLMPGGPWMIDRVQLVNSTVAASESLREFAVDVSTDGTTFREVLRATAQSGTAQQTFALAEPARAGHVRLRVLSNYGNAAYVSFAQLRVLSGQAGGPSVSFRDLSSDPNNDIVSWAWSFGDGTTSAERNPTKTYAGPGSYSVGLTVTDQGGNTRSLSMPYRVLAPPSGDFTWDVSTAREGRQTFFTVTASDPDGAIGRSFITWSDGAPQLNYNPAVPWSNWRWSFRSGTYVGRLTIEDGQGQTTTVERTITIANLPPTLTLYGDRQWGAGHPFAYTIASSDPGGDSFSCVWDMGDGRSFNGCNIAAFIYNYEVARDAAEPCMPLRTPRTYQPTVTATDSEGAASTASFTLTLYPRMAAVPGNLVRDGDFEEATEPSTFTQYSETRPFNSAWRIAPGGNVELVTNQYWDVGCSFQSLDLSGSMRGSIFQDLATVPGQTYRLRFAFAGNPVGAPTLKQAQVFWDGQLIDSPTASIVGRTQRDMGWRYQEYTVTATAATTRLQFTSLTDGVYGPVLDDISVVPVSTNRDPSVSAGGPYSVQEGGSVALSATGSDPDGDALSFAWDLDGDGTFETSGDRASFSAAAIDGPSTRAVRVRATDPTGASATAEATVQVNNVAPTATLAAPTAANAGEPFTVRAQGASDPSAADTTAGLRYAFDCGAGFGPAAGAASATCTPASPGALTVQVRVSDKDGGTSEYSAVVGVVQPNRAPGVDAGGPYSVEEGGSLGLAATGADPDGDALSYAWDLDGDGSFETSGQSVIFSAAALDGPSTRTVRVRATDGRGLSATAETTVRVSNVAPTATFAAPTQVTAGQPFTLSLTGARDAAPADALSFAFDCGAGLGAAGGATSASCTAPAAEGTVTVRAQVRDDDDGVSEYSATVRVTAPVACPVLDEFNRAGPALGGAWLGATAGYSLEGGAARASTGGLAYLPTVYGADQVACMTLTRVAASGKHHTLVLKLQDGDWGKGAILVSYDAVYRGIVVQARNVSRNSWLVAGRFPLATQPTAGAVLRAVAKADGSVDVYLSDALVGTAQAGSFYASRGGRLGVFFHQTAGGFDSFGGGSRQ